MRIKDIDLLIASEHPRETVINITRLAHKHLGGGVVGIESETLREDKEIYILRFDLIDFGIL